MEKIDKSIFLFRNYSDIVDKVAKDFKIDFYGDHGIKHWERVYENTQILASHYKVKTEVFELFALLHDSKRENEYEDIYHGLRASIFVKELLDDRLIKLDRKDEDRLIFACANHTKKDKTNPLCNDIIVQICFDSDKLDLGRVGIIPDASRMNTDFAKNMCR